jgi:hypothetical protein
MEDSRSATIIPFRGQPATRNTIPGTALIRAPLVTLALLKAAADPRRTAPAV